MHDFSLRRQTTVTVLISHRSGHQMGNFDHNNREFLMEEMNGTASDSDALLSDEEKTFLVVYVPLKVVIVAGNLLTVLTVIVDSTRHTTPYVLTASLAVADLLIGLTVFYDLALLTAPHVQPALSCPVNFIMCASLAQSTQCTTLIALDRTLTIIYPLKYPVWMTAARTAAVVATAVFFAIVYAAAVLSFVGWSAATCDIWTAVGTHPEPFAQVAPLCVCLLVTGCLYSYILLIAYRQRSTIAKMHSAVNASCRQPSFSASQQSMRASLQHAEDSLQQPGHGESQQSESPPQLRPRDASQHASKQQTKEISLFQQPRSAPQQHSTSSPYYHSGKVSPQQSATSVLEVNVTTAQEGFERRRSDCASSWQQRYESPYSVRATSREELSRGVSSFQYKTQTRVLNCGMCFRKECRRNTTPLSQCGSRSYEINSFDNIRARRSESTRSAIHELLGQAVSYHFILLGLPSPCECSHVSSSKHFPAVATVSDISTRLRDAAANSESAECENHDIEAAEEQTIVYIDSDDVRSVFTLQDLDCNESGAISCYSEQNLVSSQEDVSSLKYGLAGTGQTIRKVASAPAISQDATRASKRMKTSRSYLPDRSGSFPRSSTGRTNTHSQTNSLIHVKSLPSIAELTSIDTVDASVSTLSTSVGWYIDIAPSGPSECTNKYDNLLPHFPEEDETTGSPSTCSKNMYVKDCAQSNITVAALNPTVQETFKEDFACASSATESNSPMHESIPGNLTMNHAPSFGVSRASVNSISTFETASVQDQDARSSMPSQGQIASPKNTTSSSAMNSLIETTNKCSAAFTLPQRPSNSSSTRKSLMRTITASASSLSSSGLWKSFRMFFMVWGIYFLTMTPIIVSAWVFLFTHFSQDKVDFVVRVCFVFVYVNSGINVFIYAWKDRRLRKSLGLVLRCRWRDI